MSDIVTKFNGKRLEDLNWRERLRYAVALTKTEIQSGAFSGNIDGGKALANGITYETTQGANDEK